MSYKCKQCSKFYATRQSRWKHQQHCRGAGIEQEAKGADGVRNPKVHKLVNESVNEDDDDDVIPQFDGDEFSGKKTKSRETLYKMMKMLNILKERWDRIATDVLEEEQTPDEELPLSEHTRNLLDVEMTHPV